MFNYVMDKYSSLKKEYSHNQLWLFCESASSNFVIKVFLST